MTFPQLYTYCIWNSSVCQILDIDLGQTIIYFTIPDINQTIPHNKINYKLSECKPEYILVNGQKYFYHSKAYKQYQLI